MTHQSADELAAQKRAKTDKKRFVKLTLWGSSCICRPTEVADMLEGREPDDPIKQQEVWMTEAEFEALPEFQGF